MTQTMDHGDFCSAFAEQLAGQADWRRRKSDDFPDDADRNIAAAVELELLAKQAGEGKINPALSAAYLRAAEDRGGDGDKAGDLARSESENLRQVGFLSSYEAPDDLLETILTEARIAFKA